MEQAGRMREIFCCYAHEDLSLFDELKAHLSPLERSGAAKLWSDKDIQPGEFWIEKIKSHLNSADIILLLISSNFLNSDSCYNVEMPQALERRREGNVPVFPVILRPVVWQGTPIGQLQVLPTDAKPVSTWPDRDKAWEEVTRSILEVLNKVKYSPDEKDQTATTLLSSLDPVFDVSKLPANSMDRLLVPAQPKRQHPRVVMVILLLLSLVVLGGASIGVSTLFRGLWSAHPLHGQSTPLGQSAQAIALPQADIGVMWHPQKSGTTHDLYRIASSGSLLVAVGASGTILTSSDSINWTSQTSHTSQILYGVVWSGSLFVAVGDQGTILTSPNGITWTSQTSGTTSSLQRVASSGSRLVAVGENGTILTSSDGITWTPVHSGTTQVLYGVGASHSLFVAVGEQGTILTSPDGITWTHRTSSTTYYLDSVAWSGAFFVVTGDGGIVVTSPNGIIWSLHASGSGEALYCVASSGRLFVASGYYANNGTIYTSADGINWSPHSSGTGSQVKFLGVVWSGSRFVIVGTGGTILTSP